jgi:nucleoid-associated protein YgaU
MASLTAHLRRPGEHGRLAFHPECPLCCGDRLSGPLPSDVVVGRRTQALLAAGVLALSAAAPAAALAAEPDQEQEGTTAPDQAAAQAPPSAPDYDPGGGSTDVPVDAAPIPAPDARSAPESADDDAAPEPEPATDDDAPVADAGDGTATPAPGQQPAPAAQDVAPAPAPTAPQPTPEPAVSAPAPETPTAETPATPPGPPEPDGTRSPGDGGKREHPGPKHSTPSDAAPVASAPTSSPPNSSEPPTMLVAETQSSSSTASRGRAAQTSDRVHVVARGESLWSIAGDLLGDGASIARIAREVNRLWELNSASIGTGDPNLLMVGTRLALR